MKFLRWLMSLLIAYREASLDNRIRAIRQARRREQRL